MNFSNSKKVSLAGIEKTAILMNVLGEEKSFQLMKMLKDTDVRRLLNTMGVMKKAPIAVINSVLREFLNHISEREEIIFDDSITQMEAVVKGLGEARAKQIFGTTKRMNFVERKHLPILDEVDIKSIADLLMQEHPQMIALVAAHLDVEKQAKLIRELPESLRTEVVLRLSSLEYVPGEKLDELDALLKEQLGVEGRARKQELGGVGVVAEIMDNLDRRTRNALMSRLEDKDPILLEEVKQRMFTFNDVVKIDDKGIQLILREVSGDKLLLALKSAPDEVRDKICGAMSQRAADMLRDDLSALGPQKISDIEAAQRTIVKVIKKLEEEGKIVIGAGGEEGEVVP